MARLITSIVLLILSAALLGCTTIPHQAYRSRQCQTELVQDGAYDAECFVESPGGPGHCSTESDAGYGLAFLEFDDQGDYFEPCELDRANYLVDQANARAKAADPQKGGALVVVFVHGWRNDASDGNARDGNLANFKKTLADLTDLELACINGAETSQQRAGCTKPRPVVGIYVAWRGDYLKAIRPLKSIDWAFDWATFWNRNAAADRIASRPIATQALLLLLENVKAENPNARVIAIGHSMGALLLEQAVSQTLVTRVIDQFYDNRDNKEIHIRPLADLVVFVNSAAQAIRAQSLIDTLQIRDIRLDPPKSVTSNERGAPQAPAAATGPLLISVTAHNDNATGWLFPKALTISTRHQEFQTTIDAANKRPTQKYLMRHTPGHTPQLFSHQELYYRKENLPCRPEKSTEPEEKQNNARVSDLTGVVYCSESTTDGSVLAFSVQSKGGFETYRLVRDPAATNHSPYWILQVPHDVIDGHSKIFEQPFRDFLRGLLVVTGAVSPEYTRTYGAPLQTPKSTQPDAPPALDEVPLAPPQPPN
jgi:hypothetical protein